MAEESSSSSIMGWYIPKPKAISFETQLPNEPILLFLRQHPIVLLFPIGIILAMLIAPMLILPLLVNYLSIPPLKQLLLLAFWYLFTFGISFEQFLLWFYNSFLITDERMVDIDFHNIISKRINYAQLEKIEDVTQSTAGVLYSLLHAGTVNVQTAAEVPEFSFENIAKPERVVKLLNELVLEEEQEKIEGRVR